MKYFYFMEWNVIISFNEEISQTSHERENFA